LIHLTWQRWLEWTREGSVIKKKLRIKNKPFARDPSKDMSRRARVAGSEQVGRQAGRQTNWQANKQEGGQRW